MDEPKKQLVDKLKSANNILVTVSRDPSVDQLAALLGLSLLLNKAGKHAAAVFSGEVPSTLQFLQPDATIEKNTDSLRDFIIALDKSKADKLRYKVEDNIVKIFITPYKTSITQDDFQFSQGDFNVDVVVAIGVQKQEDLDDAITAHGRILHDATVASINTSPDGGLGSLNWHDTESSSLSQLVAELAQDLNEDPFDEQIATALLTGIVAETDRFRNEKTSSRTMTASALLLSAGANQQLVASQLDAPVEPEKSADDQAGQSDQSEDDDQTADDVPKTGKDGVLDIDHDKDETDEPLNLPEPSLNEEEVDPGQPESDSTSPSSAAGLSAGSKIVTQPPTLGGTLTANSSLPKLDPITDPLSTQGKDSQIFEHKSNPALNSPGVSGASSPADGAALTPPPANWTPPTPPATASASSQPGSAPGPSTTPATTLPTNIAQPGQTLSDIESSVSSSHSDEQVSATPSPSTTTGTPQPTAGELDAAREEVNRALKQGLDPSQPPTEPVQALNAQPMGGDLHPVNPLPEVAPSLEEQIPGLSTKLGQPPKDLQQEQEQTDKAESDHAQSTQSDSPPSDDSQPKDPNSPPPVPPPIPFQFGKPPAQQ